jgi:cytochrome c oxidase subunit 2
MTSPWRLSGATATTRQHRRGSASLHLTSRVRRRAVVAVAFLLLALGAAACSDPQTTIDPKSDYADSVHGVYTIVFWLAAIVFVVVLAMVLAFSLAFRERPGREARQFHGNTRLEALWTLIPVVIVVIISVPTIKAIVDTSGSPPDDAVEIEVIGHQWWFEFRYTGLDITTANEIHLKVDQAVSFKLRSTDVIHSFWIPQLAGKMDIVPGHENEIAFTPNEPGTYRGLCAEFCGLSHANMRFRVIVDTAADFEAWVANEQAGRTEPATDALAAGEQLFLSNACVGCHTIQGTAAAGQIGPDLTHVGARTTIAAGILDNTQENLIRWISNPDREKPGVVLMPAFEKQLSGDQIASIAAYLGSLR